MVPGTVVEAHDKNAPQTVVVLSSEHLQKLTGFTLVVPLNFSENDGKGILTTEPRRGFLSYALVRAVSTSDLKNQQGMIDSTAIVKLSTVLKYHGIAL